LKPDTREVLAALSAAEVDRLLGHIEKGERHPEALALSLGLSRATIESRLNGLVRVGVLERYTVPGDGNRPKVMYRPTSAAKPLVEDAEALIETHWRRLSATKRAEMAALEEQFLYGRIPEEEFRKRRREVEQKYENIVRFAERTSVSVQTPGPRSQ